MPGCCPCCRTVRSTFPNSRRACRPQSVRRGKEWGMLHHRYQGQRMENAIRCQVQPTMKCTTSGTPIDCPISHDSVPICRIQTESTHMYIFFNKKFLEYFTSSTFDNLLLSRLVLWGFSNWICSITECRPLSSANARFDFPTILPVLSTSYWWELDHRRRWPA